MIGYVRENDCDMAEGIFEVLEKGYISHVLEVGFESAIVSRSDFYDRVGNFFWYRDMADLRLWMASDFL